MLAPPLPCYQAVNRCPHTYHLLLSDSNPPPCVVPWMGGLRFLGVWTAHVIHTPTPPLRPWGFLKARGHERRAVAQATPTPRQPLSASCRAALWSLGSLDEGADWNHPLYLAVSHCSSIWASSKAANLGHHDWIRKVRAWKKLFRFFFSFSIILKIFPFFFFFFSLTLSYFLLFPTVLPFYFHLFSLHFSNNCNRKKKKKKAFIIKKKKKSFSFKFLEFP